MIPEYVQIGHASRAYVDVIAHPRCMEGVVDYYLDIALDNYYSDHSDTLHNNTVAVAAVFDTVHSTCVHHHLSFCRVYFDDQKNYSLICGLMKICHYHHPQQQPLYRRSYFYYEN